MQHDPLKKYLAISIVFFFIFSSIPIAKCTATENESKSEFPATGFFYVAEKNAVWWFVTPKGEKFYSVGVQGVGPSEFYYSNISDWVETTRKRLDEWGFNSIIGGTRELFPSIPYVYRFRFKQLVGEHGWVPNPRFPDVFDPDWRNTVRNLINETATACRNDSNLIGYQTDNEMKWGPDYLEPGLGDKLTLLELYMSAPSEAPGKKELVRFIRERYNNTGEFNRVWDMNIQDFSNLFNFTKFGIEGWRVQSQLRSVKIKLYRDNPFLLKEPQLLEQAEKDITDFSRLVAKTYFNVTSTALKVADPNHLNLGVRFHLLGVPREVLEECGKYVDVISINYYRSNIFLYDPSVRLNSIKYGCVPLDRWMLNYYEITGKPLLVSEFSFNSNDGSWLSDSNLLSPTSPCTQKKRADIFEWYATNCQKNPYMIGYFWFVYRDTFDINFGLVNLWDEPYLPLVSRAAKINDMTVEIHQQSSKSTSIKEPLRINIIHDFVPLSINLNKKCGTAKEIKDFSPLDINNNYYYLKKKNIIYVDDEPGEGPSNPSENYTRIEDAIDKAKIGDTIFVYNGTYHEKLIINKSISLVGEDKIKTVISGILEEPDNKYQNRVITIEGDYVNITGFNITTEGGYIGSSGGFNFCSGIYFKKYNASNISGNIFYKLAKYGLMSLKSDYTKIINNIFYDVKGCGIVTDSSNNSLIRNNVFESDGSYGIWMSSCKNNTIKNNFISKSKFGIIIFKANYNTVFGNTLQKNKPKGICLKESNHNTITSNNFIGNPTPASFFYSSDNVWDGNFWGRFRFLPTLIFGKTGADRSVTVVAIDHHPLKEPYKL